MLQSKLDHAEEWVAIVGIQQQAAVHELAHVLATATTPDGMLMPGVMWGPMQIASVRAALDAIVTPPAMSPEQMAHKAYASHQQVRLTPTLFFPSDLQLTSRVGKAADSKLSQPQRIAVSDSQQLIERIVRLIICTFL